MLEVNNFGKPKECRLGVYMEDLLFEKLLHLEF